MTDFRALCAELLDELLYHTDWSDAEKLKERARAALADGPAVPIPPAALPEGYIDPEHSGDDRALLQTFYSACLAEGGTADEITLRGLRAVLADGPAVPEGREPASVTGQPSDEDLNRLLWYEFTTSTGHGERTDPIAFARAVLARWGNPAPQPVPVSERLPRAEDCDAEGRCWLRGKAEGDWRLLDPNNSGVPQLKYCFTHWLPAHALPIPQQQQENTNG